MDNGADVQDYLSELTGQRVSIALLLRNLILLRVTTGNRDASNPDPSILYLIFRPAQSVPNIFIQGKHLGGSDDLLAAISNGRLATMLEVKAGL
jgi:hypothetical protein